MSNLLPGLASATSLLILVNGFWFLILLLAQLRAGSAESSGPSLFGGFDGELLLHFGSGASWLSLSGEWWRIVTPIFLHGGLLHFFFNTYVLLQLGPLSEQIYGTARFWVIYLICGIAGSAASQALRPVNTVGASGAIMGLMGLLLVHGWRSGRAGEGLKQAMLQYALYIAVFSFLVHGIDHFNHAGGFVAGALAGLAVPARAPRTPWGAALWQAAATLGAVLVLLAFYMVATHLEPPA